MSFCYETLLESDLLSDDKDTFKCSMCEHICGRSKESVFNDVCENCYLATQSTSEQLKGLECSECDNIYNNLIDHKMDGV